MIRQSVTFVQAWFAPPDPTPHRRSATGLRCVAGWMLWVILASAPTGLLSADDPQPSDAALAAYADAANFQTGGAIELAIEGWKKFLEDYPDNPMASKAAHYLGVCYMQREKPDYVAASRAFDQALRDKKYDLREESLANHGWCLYASAGSGPQADPKKLKQAWDVFETLRKENPESRFLDRALFYCGEAAYGLGQAEKAVSYYNELLSLPTAKDSPLRCDALYARGVALEELDQFEQAIASYNQLLGSCESGDLVTDVQLRMGDLLILRKQFDKSIASFADAFKSSQSAEDRAYALFRQAFALVQSERPGEAAQKYEQLLREFPDSPYAATATLASAQSMYRSGDIDTAADRFTEVLTQNNPVAATEAAHWLARIEISKNRPQQAAEVVRKQIARGAQGEFATDLRLDLAEALAMDPSTVAESMELFEQTYRQAPDDDLAPRALYNAAFSALQINQPQKALELAGEFIDKFPNDTLLADVKFVAAEGEMLTGNAEAASRMYAELISSTPKENIQRPLWLLRAAAASNAAGKMDQTVTLLTKEISSLATAAQKAEAQMLLGQAHMMAGRAAEAAQAFEASHAADATWPRADEALLMVGQAQLVAGHTKQAADTWNELIKAAPNSRMADQARYKLAQVANAEGNFGQGVQWFDQILASKQDAGLIPYAQYGRGFALLQVEKFAPALEALNKLLQDYPQHPLANEARLARGITFRNLAKYDEARQDLEQFLATAPQGTNLGHALYELALIEQKAKQPGEAAEKLRRLVDQVPSYPSMDKVLYELGWSLQESGDDQGAIKYFTALIEQFPNTPLVSEAAYFVGQKHYIGKDWKSAADQFLIAAHSASDADLSEKSYYRLGWSRFKAQDFTAAEEAFREQAQKHPQGKLAFDATMMIGECRFQRSDFKTAVAGYEAARQRIRDNNDNSNSIRDSAERQVRELTLLHGGQSAAQLKAWDDAIGWYDELRERFPASSYLPQVFYETGFAYQQKGDSQNALKFFAEVANNYRNELAARSRFMMGEIYFSNREFDKAIPEFQRVMFGFGADKAPDSIKNWQAKSGFEAARCSELLLQQAKTPSSQQKALKFSQDFFSYVIENHPQHELAEKSRERLEAISK